jgi:ABC-type Fe3+-siderophore transport system permease subunit
VRNAAAGCLGLILGALAGAALGVGLGLLWTTALHTSCFEGYCGMLVFFTFMPIGAILGAVVGAIALAMLARREPSSPSATGGDGVTKREQDDRP